MRRYIILWVTGIRVTMYYDNHNPPRFHAEYNRNKATVEQN